MKKDLIKILFFGDIVGRNARNKIISVVYEMREEFGCDFVVANCENAAGGFGVTPSICNELLDSGIDVLTSGNHIWDKPEISSYIAKENCLLRPLNMIREYPGNGSVIVKNSDGFRLGVVNILTNLFMQKSDNLFISIDKLLEKLKLSKDADAIIIDIHGEATSEKMAFGHYVDGRVSAVLGTHTHVPTSDCRILSLGTAFQTDVGMCGDYNSVIGMDKKLSIQKFLGKKNKKFMVAKGEATICATLVEININTGLAKSICSVKKFGCL